MITWLGWWLAVNGVVLVWWVIVGTRWNRSGKDKAQ